MEALAIVSNLRYDSGLSGIPNLSVVSISVEWTNATREMWVTVIIVIRVPDFLHALLTILVTQSGSADTYFSFWKFLHRKKKVDVELET
ncbi:hypothetical protein HDU80_007554 [Chytriomyces hyalinus]|nr:hypothetical protein HDU80_007554 [Chytriomyces hyalinus]